ncbi:MAG: tetratricopeptide repeat protein [Ktedonobacteraceae bacterium]|nr:tetratricopeptide repeat protein [Ktedonobacteraceae bacterium]
MMNYATKGTLRRRHPRGIRVPLANIVPYVKQIAAALQYAHEENLVHRDVKPENMLIDEQENVLLSDFGIAIVTQSMQYGRQFAQDSTGTPQYMAPEQFLGRPGRASDQYALGIVVYEWLSGSCPFNGTLYELPSQHMHVTPPSLQPFCPPAIEQIVMRALAKKPEERFESVQAFAIALEEQYKLLAASQGQVQAQPQIQVQTPLQAQATMLPTRTKENYLKEGDSLYDAQLYAEAITAYSRAIALAPDDALAYHNRGLTYRNLHNYQQAIADYSRAIALAPGVSFFYNNRGYAYSLLHNYQQAIADYDRAIALEPNYAQAYMNRANAYCALGICIRAISDFDRVLTLLPDYATAYYNRGNAYEELKEYQRALADYDRAIALDPAYAKAYTNRGYVHAHLGDHQRALADYDRALALDPTNIIAYNARGLAHSQLQQFAQAIADFDRALELDPTFQSVLDNKTNVLRKLQEQKEQAF